MSSPRPAPPGALRAGIYHRHLGFFRSGIVAVYAISGIVMIFRNTDFLKQETVVENVAPKLLIFIVSAFWMYLPGGPVLRKGVHLNSRSCFESFF